METERKEEAFVSREDIRKAAGSISSAVWGAGVLVSLAIIVGATAITFAALKSAIFTPMNQNRSPEGVAQVPSRPLIEPSAPSADTVIPEEEKKNQTVLIGSSPILGDRSSATVAIIEWSDYECPFCKRFDEDAYEDIVSKYVDTGKVIFVFKNYPLSFHGETAMKEANAALCVREVAGDKSYFSMMRDIYAETGTNGEGMSNETLLSIAAKNAGRSVASCIENRKFDTEIERDMKEAEAVGISATPSFVIGTIGENGQVTGDLIEGAMPFSDFERAIDSLLSEEK